MTERHIFRNIQHVPRVWGVSYIKLFASLGVGLLITTAGFALTTGTLGKISMLILGAVITLGLYGVSYWIERQDALDRDLAFIKNGMNSQSLSYQKIQIKG